MKALFGALVAAVSLTSLSAETLISPNPDKLAPGEFEWRPERSPNAPLLIVCSLDDQLLYAFRNGVTSSNSHCLRIDNLLWTFSIMAFR